MVSWLWSFYQDYFQNLAAVWQSVGLAAGKTKNRFIQKVSNEYNSENEMTNNASDEIFSRDTIERNAVDSTSSKPSEVVFRKKRWLNWDTCCHKDLNFPKYPWLESWARNNMYPDLLWFLKNLMTTVHRLWFVNTNGQNCNFYLP